MPRDDLDRVVAHGLGHTYFDAEYAELLWVVEEGLCELPSTNAARDLVDAIYVSLVVDPAAVNLSSLVVAVERSDLPDVESCLAATRSEYERSSAGVRHAMFGVGRVLARQIGAEGLHELCRRARDAGLDTVPADWLFGEAGIESGSVASWRTVLGEFDVSVSLPMLGGKTFTAVPMVSPERAE